MNIKIKYIGMDVHKDSISIAIADSDSYEVRSFGKIAMSPSSLLKFIHGIESHLFELRFVYEAGPTGYEIYRYLKKLGYVCEVVAPSLIPIKPGVRVKTDRRDAIKLARLFRAGELTSVYVPLPEDEAMRDLTRAREDMKITEKKAKQRLLGFLLRHGYSYSAQSKNWSKKHIRWIGELKMDHIAQQVVIEEYLQDVEESIQRVGRLTQQIQDLCKNWRLKEVVKAFQAFRGVSLIVASTFVSELGDITRFDHPKQLMSFLGLVPSESSSGGNRRQGGITKSGNGHVRRVLVEGCWAYRYPPRVIGELRKRQKDVPKKIKDISWKAQIRLNQRYRTLSAKGKNKNKITVAIARELLGFLWACAKEIQLPQIA